MLSDGSEKVMIWKKKKKSIMQITTAALWSAAAVPGRPRPAGGPRV